jgi:hypothetical protein
MPGLSHAALPEPPHICLPMMLPDPLIALISPKRPDPRRMPSYPQISGAALLMIDQIPPVHAPFHRLSRVETSELFKRIAHSSGIVDSPRYRVAGLVDSPYNQLTSPQSWSITLSPTPPPEANVKLPRQSSCAPATSRFALLRRSLASGYWYWSADEFARIAGASSRHALHRRLTRCGLPAYRNLMAISRVAAAHRLCRRTGRSMSCASRSIGMNPGWCSRTTRFYVGLPWEACLSLRTADLVRRAIRVHGNPSSTSG